MPRDSNENFYDHKDIKKYLPHISDTQVEVTGMPVTSHIGFFGATGSSKSNSLLNYIKRTDSVKGGTYDQIFMLVRKLEPFNYLLKEKLGDRINFFTELKDFPDVKAFPDLSKDNKKCYLIIFDDFITEKNTKNIKKVEDYLIFGRAKGCTVVLLSQSYFQTNILLRKQLSFICLCGIKSNRDLKAILSEYSMGEGIDIAKMQKMYKYAKIQDFKDEPTFLKINSNVCPENVKFSRNYLEYLNPNDF